MDIIIKFYRTIGMFEQNNVGVRLTNPIATFLQNLDGDSAHLREFLCEVQLVANSIEDDGTFHYNFLIEIVLFGFVFPCRLLLWSL